jgi:hypothetical protein
MTEAKAKSHGCGWLAAAGLIAILAAASCFFSGWPFNHVRPPRIGKGWLSDEDWRNPEAGSEKFSTVLSRDFPIGSRSDLLRRSLMDQGFVRSGRHLGYCDASRCEYADTTNELEYQWGGFPCSETLRASWLSDARGRITQLAGHYFGSCM